MLVKIIAAFKARYAFGTDVRVHVEEFPEERRTRLTLKTREDEIITEATVSLADIGIYPAPGNVLIKSFSQNEGVMQGLIRTGVIGNPVHAHKLPTSTGLERTVYECPLLATEPIEDPNPYVPVEE